MSLDWSTIAIASCTLLSSVLAWAGIRTISQHDESIADLRASDKELRERQDSYDRRLLVVEVEHKNRKCGEE